ncbi:permease-like cell division protein FtsX [Nonomuraea polychroma]|uniref:permease-like cell division protein FtsX n=1 Tax=Nonomuraea polychroma TaxID=46176 RepID=UPI003D8C7BF9
MNSPVEDRLREALAEAGAAIDPSTLRPLRAPERRRLRMDFRLVAVAVVVVLAGVATAAVLGSPEGTDRAVATDPKPAQTGNADLTVFLCAKTASKAPPCLGRAVRVDEVKVIERMVKELPQLQSAHFDNQAVTYDRFRAEFAHDKALLDAVKITDMPHSFRLTLKAGADRRAVQQALEGTRGVQSVVDHATEAVEPPEKRLMSVFLCNDASTMSSCGAVTDARGKGTPELVKEGKATTSRQKASITKLIEAMPEVQSYVFEDRKTAYENFRRDNKANKALIEATRVEDMPESFRLTLKPEADWSKVADELMRQPGVSTVVYSPCVQLQSVLRARYGLSLPDGRVCGSVR